MNCARCDGKGEFHVVTARDLHNAAVYGQTKLTAIPCPSCQGTEADKERIATLEVAKAALEARVAKADELLIELTEHLDLVMDGSGCCSAKECGGHCGYLHLKGCDAIKAYCDDVRRAEMTPEGVRELKKARDAEKAALEARLQVAERGRALEEETHRETIELLEAARIALRKQHEWNLACVAAQIAGAERARDASAAALTGAPKEAA